MARFHPSGRLPTIRRGQRNRTVPIAVVYIPPPPPAAQANFPPPPPPDEPVADPVVEVPLPVPAEAAAARAQLVVEPPPLAPRRKRRAGKTVMRMRTMAANDSTRRQSQVQNTQMDPNQEVIVIDD